MKKHRLSLIILMTLGMLIIGPLIAHAQQQGPQVVVLHTVAEPQSTSLDLQVFFSIQDDQGRPLAKDQVNVESATLQLLSGFTTPLAVDIQDPKTPIKIAVLIDASGSMAQQVQDGSGRRIIDAVRESAKKAIDTAPPNAAFAVFRFSQLAVDAELRPLSDGFTSDKELVKRDIDTIDAIPDGQTCLYNAAYKVIENLAREVDKTPQERRAIILFTDGKNEGDGCDARTTADVIAKATSGNLTPIFVIGFCTDEQCSNVDPSIKDKEGRNDIAAKTSAFSVLSQASNIDTAFTEIMQGLNSQFLVQANVFPRQGQNQAVLTVKLRDRELPLVHTFTFSSDRDYFPAPTIDVTQVYLAETDTFSVALNITNPESVQRINVGVWDRPDGGNLISSSQQSFENIGGTLSFELKAIGFEAGKDYYLRVMAQDKTGKTITNDKGEPTLFINPFPYNPKLDFEIEAVEPVWNEDILAIKLNIRGSGGRVLAFRGVITDKETGQSEIIESIVAREGQLRIPLPNRLRQLSKERSYTVMLQLEDGEKVIERSKERLIAPPVTSSPPWVLLGFVLVGIVGALVLFGLLKYRRSRTKKYVIPQPSPFSPPTQMLAPSAAPANLTMLHTPATPGVTPPPPARLRIKVLATVDPAQQRQETISDFPCVLGREPGPDRQKSYFLITGDPKLSRAHAEITLNGNVFSITDTSINGTFVGDAETRLEKGVPTPIGRPTRVQLSINTVLEIEPLTNAGSLTARS